MQKGTHIRDLHPLSLEMSFTRQFFFIDITFLTLIIMEHFVTFQNYGGSDLTILISEQQEQYADNCSP